MGNDVVTIPLPVFPSLIGLPGHTQVVTLFGPVYALATVDDTAEMHIP